MKDSSFRSWKPENIFFFQINHLSYCIIGHSRKVKSIETLWKKIKNILMGSTFSERLPSRFMKAGKVWCGGALETHWATCQYGVIVSKTKQSFKSSCFSRSLWYLFNFPLLLGCDVRKNISELLVNVIMSRNKIWFKIQKF